jgi:hypothetical protein
MEKIVDKIIRTCKYKVSDECAGTASILKFKTGLNCCLKCASHRNIEYYHKNKAQIQEKNKMNARKSYYKAKELVKQQQLIEENLAKQLIASDCVETKAINV